MSDRRMTVAGAVEPVVVRRSPVEEAEAKIGGELTLGAAAGIDGGADRPAGAGADRLICVVPERVAKLARLIDCREDRAPDTIGDRIDHVAPSVVDLLNAPRFLLGDNASHRLTLPRQLVEALTALRKHVDELLATAS